MASQLLPSHPPRSAPAPVDCVKLHSAAFAKRGEDDVSILVGFACIHGLERCAANEFPANVLEAESLAAAAVALDRADGEHRDPHVGVRDRLALWVEKLGSEWLGFREAEL